MSDPRLQNISVFQYLDYRAFLRDWYRSAKGRYGFSYRVFSRKAGFSSSNIYKLIMEGKRNLTEESIRKFSLGVSLGRREGQYFRLLVLFNQSKDHENKNDLLQQIIRFRKVQRLQPLIRDQFDYFSTWYHPVVRELILVKGWDGSPEWIAGKINPAISVAQVKNSLELLERLNLIEKVPGNCHWRQSSALVTSGAESDKHILTNYHQSLFKLMAEQMRNIPQELRDVSALTLGISKKRFPELKKKIQEFRKEILQWVSEDSRSEEVVLLGMQIFPMTRTPKKGTAS